MSNNTIITTIDELGLLRAQIAELELKEKELKARLGDLAPGAYEGNVFRLAISETVREGYDKVMKAKIEELVVENFSVQYITAHTVKTDVRTLRTSSRNGKGLVAA
jgi:hypothetical protein